MDFRASAKFSLVELHNVVDGDGVRTLSIILFEPVFDEFTDFFLGYLFLESGGAVFLAHFYF